MAWIEGQHVTYRWATPLLDSGRPEEILCEIIDPRPFIETRRDHGRLRLCVRCIDERDPMYGKTFIPYEDRLCPVSSDNGNGNGLA